MNGSLFLHEIRLPAQQAVVQIALVAQASDR